MKIREILRGLMVRETAGDLDGTVSGIVVDSRRAKAGYCYIARKGLNSDGHDFIPQAIENGAVFFIVEKFVEALRGRSYAVVDDTHAAAGVAFSNYHRCPDRDMIVSGVTGTDGKSSTAILVSAVFEAGGLPCGLIGTIYYKTGASVVDSKLTTPDSPELFGLITEMRTNGMKALSIEVSSHSIAQRRISGLHFSIGIFTCIGRDHLEYHGTQEEYERVKMSLFTEILPCSEKLLGAVINIDDYLGRRIADAVNYKKLTLSMHKEVSDIFPLREKFSVEGIEALLRTPIGDIEIRSELTGRFNLMNIMSAAAAGILAGVKPWAIKEGLEGVKEIPGRLQRVRNNKGVNLFVDYSHTPRAIENVLASLRQMTAGKLIFIGGAGGDRDPGKRPLMGSAAYRGSDIAIITSDNPRSEDPEEIIRQIVQGILREKEKGLDKFYYIEPDRRKAIQKGLEIARAGDTVVICGKGHECYQILKDRTIRFSDAETAREILNG